MKQFFCCLSNVGEQIETFGLCVDILEHLGKTWKIMENVKKFSVAFFPKKVGLRAKLGRNLVTNVVF